uniref:Uncharacterized protein n=1 Tax=Romanomermis culicivorax TaxID=13658 RepID=A0A915IGS6_ROMCU
MACFQLDLDSDDSKEDDQDSGLIMKNCSSDSLNSSPSSDIATPLAAIDNYFNFNDPKTTNRKISNRFIQRQRYKAHCQFDESWNVYSWFEESLEPLFSSEKSE